MQLPIGIFGFAIASATLPSISRSASVNDIDGFRVTLSRSLGMVFLLTVPSAVGLAVLSESIVGAIYQLGEFTAYSTAQTAHALAYYAIGLAGYAAAKVLNPAFYALGDSRTPMALSTVSIAINFVVAITAVNALGLGHAGLALSTSCVAIFSSVGLLVIMRNRIGGIDGRNLWASFMKVAAASTAMAAVVWPVNYAVHAMLGQSKIAHLVTLVLAIPTGVVVLYFACKSLRVPELEAGIAAVAGPMQRRLPFLRRRSS
jgi:putative peptidoglycan lipid II flippase